MASTLSGRIVTISEINFDKREFIEFYNHTEDPVDLTGFTIIGGIDAFLVGTLQPQEYAVIVSDTLSFRNEYGSAPRIISEYERILDNDGEEISLRDPSGEIVIRIDYKIPERGRLTVTDNWPPDLSIDEHPLEFTFPNDPDLSQSEGPNWRRAYRRDGTPGRGTDSDQDGLDDEWETYTFRAPEPLSPLASDDPDGDGWDNFTEQRNGTSPTRADTDQDGIPDPYETGTGFYVSPDNTGTNPIDSDTDRDGLRDGQEVPLNTPVGTFATDPHNADSDGDSHSDGREVNFLGDPLDPTIFPKPPEINTFEPSAPTISAVQPITLSWDIRGSSSESLTPHPQNRTSLYPSKGSLTFAPVNKTELLPADQVWKYDLSTTDFGDTWTQPNFDDSGWATGTTPFSENNLIGNGVTPYFRTQIEIPEPLPVNRITWTWSHGGAGAIYLDGQLTQQDQLPSPFERAFQPFTGFGGTQAFISPPLNSGFLTISAESHTAAFGFQPYFDLSISQSHPITGLQTYTLEATNPYGTTQQTIEVMILDDLPPLQTYHQWALEKFPQDEAAQNDQSDPDQDGISNLLEFLTGSDPTAPNADPLSMTPVYYPESDNPLTSEKFAYFEFSFHHNRNPGNASLRLESSEDFITWESHPTLFNPSNPFFPEIQIIDAHREKLTYRANTNRRPKFFRLRGITTPHN